MTWTRTTLPACERHEATLGGVLALTCVGRPGGTWRAVGCDGRTFATLAAAQAAAIDGARRRVTAMLAELDGEKDQAEQRAKGAA